MGRSAWNSCRWRGPTGLWGCLPAVFFQPEALFASVCSSDSEQLQDRDTEPSLLLAQGPKLRNYLKDACWKNKADSGIFNIVICPFDQVVRLSPASVSCFQSPW